MTSSKIGNFFFKLRSYTPIPIILMMLYYASPTGYSVSFGLLFIILGESIRIWAVGYAGGTTRATALGAARDLVTTGPYSYVRNPLYLGNFILSFGVCIISNVLWVIPILTIGYFVQYLPIISVEETYLSESCGTVYESYYNNVPRLLPQLNPYPTSSSHDFSLKRALNSEKRTLTAILCVIGLLYVRQFIPI
ncbi:isoprenylcysteine carboxylmethyltransferase family protein [Candidatus Poribacteria bacterium]|nr:isoprenylcysteine carboxylmethyltransferase family protein [Candidatus Poribacteria bacterium]